MIHPFARVEPTVLLAVDGYRYNGRDFDRLDVVRSLERELPGLRRSIVLPCLTPEPDLGGFANALRWDEFLGDDAPPAG